MAKRIDAEERQRICRRYRQCGSYSRVAKELGHTPDTVRRVVQEENVQGSAAAPGRAERSAEAGKAGADGSTAPDGTADTQDLAAFMETRRNKVCRVIDLYLSALCRPEKIEGASVSQLSNSLSTLVEKFGRDREKGNDPVQIALNMPEEWTR